MFTNENQGKEILLRIVRSCRKALRLADIFSQEVTTDCTRTVFDEIGGDLEDALYYLNQEHTEELSKSIVDQLLRNEKLSDLDVTDTLYKLIASKENKDKTPPTRKKLTEALKNKGFEDDFIQEYGSVIFTKENLLRFTEGDPAVMETIENYHDEWTYLNCDCTGDDDLIVMTTNEAWTPDPDEQ